MCRKTYFYFPSSAEILGYLYYRFVGCGAGSCALTSNPFRFPPFTAPRSAFLRAFPLHKTCFSFLKSRLPSEGGFFVFNPWQGRFINFVLFFFSIKTVPVIKAINAMPQRSSASRKSMKESPR